MLNPMIMPSPPPRAPDFPRPVGAVGCADHLLQRAGPRQSRCWDAGHPPGLPAPPVFGD